MVSPREFEAVEELRGKESRSSWVRRAVQAAISLQVSTAPEHLDQLPDNYPDEVAICPRCRAGIGPDNEGEYSCSCGWFPGATDNQDEEDQEESQEEVSSAAPVVWYLHGRGTRLLNYECYAIPSTEPGEPGFRAYAWDWAQTPPEKTECPVLCLTWDQAAAACEHLAVFGFWPAECPSLEWAGQPRAGASGARLFDMARVLELPPLL